MANIDILIDKATQELIKNDPIAEATEKNAHEAAAKIAEELKKNNIYPQLGTDKDGNATDTKPLIVISKAPKGDYYLSKIRFGTKGECLDLNLNKDANISSMTAWETVDGKFQRAEDIKESGLSDALKAVADYVQTNLVVEKAAPENTREPLPDTPTANLVKEANKYFKENGEKVTNKDSKTVSDAYAIYREAGQTPDGKDYGEKVEIRSHTAANEIIELNFGNDDKLYATMKTFKPDKKYEAPKTLQLYGAAVIADAISLPEIRDFVADKLGINLTEELAKLPPMKQLALEANEYFKKECQSVLDNSGYKVPSAFAKYEKNEEYGDKMTIHFRDEADSNKLVEFYTNKDGNLGAAVKSFNGKGEAPTSFSLSDAEKITNNISSSAVRGFVADTLKIDLEKGHKKTQEAIEK